MNLNEFMEKGNPALVLCYMGGLAINDVETQVRNRCYEEGWSREAEPQWIINTADYLCRKYGNEVCDRLKRAFPDDNVSWLKVHRLFVEAIKGEIADEQKRFELLYK